MSGGVDSSTVAVMMKEDYNVIGITLNFMMRIKTSKSKQCCEVKIYGCKDMTS